MPLTRLIYSKKCILPSKAAHVLQSLNMAYSFAEQGVHTTMWPGFKRRDYSGFKHALEVDYGLKPSSKLDMIPLYGGQKGLYGLGFRARLFNAWVNSPPGTVFYARDITEALLLARFKRFLKARHPVFYELHELLGEQHKILNSGLAGRYSRIEAEMLARMDGVVCISPVLVDELANVYGYSGPVLVAPMGFNHRLFKAFPDVDFTGLITIAYVGSLYEGKGIHNLVRAMGRLSDRFRLLVVGANPGHELKRLKNLAYEMNLSDHKIEFCGHLPQKDIFSRLESCSIMVIPQISEAEFFSPIKLYEAIGMGLPLVVTPVPALTSVLEQGVDAIVASSSAPEDLAAALDDMASNQDRARQMQRRCRGRSVHSTWCARADLCLDFMHSIVM